MRPSVVLSLLACSLFSTPAFAAWDIFQSYVIIDAGSGNQFLAGGYNADAASTFDASDLGTFEASDVLTLNGGELKTYKNGSSNVCGGNVYYRVYASADTPGSFNSVALPYDSDLANAGDQKWDETAAGIDLLAGLTAGGTYTLEVYWDLTGAESDPAGCGETKFDSDFGNNFTASFTFNVPGCTDANYAEYDANANTDDSSCATLIDPCDGALVLGSVSVSSVPTAIDAADGEIDIDVTTGTATALDLTGVNGAGDYSFSLPGAMNGILPGTYDANAEDAGGCNSNTVSLIVPYAQCCDGCGVYDVDTDGICDDSDNCTDKLATNYNDPTNEACIFPGCTDPAYLEYDATANTDDGSCSALIVEGCTDGAADNYNATANTDDGSCIITGCTDPAADNYNAAANTDDDSCIFTGCTDAAADNYDATANTDDGSCIFYGCTDTDADNYDATANTDDGSCIYYGCTDPAADNYDATANTDDGSCIITGCTDPAADNYNAAANTDDDSCIFTGCTDAAADNYDATANTDDGSCIYYGCTDADADNYDATANTDDGSCIFYGCTDAAADNYDATANTDDGSCIYYGCTDAAYMEYDATANTDDGSCQCLVVDPACVSPSMDGYGYDVVQIGCQCWFAENLRTTEYRNGDVIPANLQGLAAGMTLADLDWYNTTSGATAVYGEGSSNCGVGDDDASACDETQSLTDYGRLYNWYAVDDARGLCPSGWHVPTNGEWDDLKDYITSQVTGSTEGRALKSTSGWNSAGNGTDDFGFSALPGGYRDYFGRFMTALYSGLWWSSSLDGTDAVNRRLTNISDLFLLGNSDKRNGYSVRCIKD